MKKLSVFAILVVLSMVLAACGGSGSQMTPTAVGGVGPVGTEAGGALPTTPAATEAVGGLEPTTVAMTPVGTALGTNIPATGENDVNRLKNMLDFNVIDSSNNDLGDVNDIIVDANGGMIRFVAVGSGGFLGIGEKTILVPWNMIQVGVDNDNNNVFVFSGTADALKNAPDVDLDNLDFNNSNWDMDFNNYWSNPSTVISGTSVAGTPVATSEPMNNLQPTAGAGAASGNITRGAAADFVLASKLVKADVVDQSVFNGGAAGTSVPGVNALPTGQGTSAFDNNSGMTTGTSVAGGVDVNNMTTLGTVTDAVVDPATGSVTYLIVAPDASLNMGDKWIPVPLSQAQIVYKGDNDSNFVVLIPADRLSKAPSFDVNGLPNTSTTGWDADLQSYWGVAR